MEIILKQDYPGLGHKNDLVKVRDGYARNFLIPKGIAVMATENAKKNTCRKFKTTSS
jgi:large subunit ribosomal protein L9